jgi:hypothetical protein
MDLLITLIGNAAVDPIFRKRFLANPIDTADEYGFRFTKGDFEMMSDVFAGLTPEEKQDLELAFKGVQDLLYKNIQVAQQRVCHPPCAWSIYPPPEPHELRKEWQKAAAA